jgi:hypothetical protein
VVLSGLLPRLFSRSCSTLVDKPSSRKTLTNDAYLWRSRPSSGTTSPLVGNARSSIAVISDSVSGSRKCESHTMIRTISLYSSSRRETRYVFNHRVDTWRYIFQAVLDIPLGPSALQHIEGGVCPNERTVCLCQYGSLDLNAERNRVIVVVQIKIAKAFVDILCQGV